MKTREPPCTERYARWCERSGDFIEFPSYSILQICWICCILLIEMGYVFVCIYLGESEQSDSFFANERPYVGVMTDE